MSTLYVDHIANAHIDPTGQTMRFATQTFGPDPITGQPSLAETHVLIVPITEIDNLLELLQNARSILQPKKEETTHE